MHLRKARKAKVAASEFVKRVISGKDVSPERKEPSQSKGSKPSTPKLKTRGAVATASRAQSRSPSRGRPSSPRPARPNSPKAASSSATSSTPPRGASRSPSRAPASRSSTTETKPTAKEEKNQPSVKAPRPRGRPRKYPKVTKEETVSDKETNKVDKQEDRLEQTQVKEVEALKRSERRRGSKSAESSPVAKLISSPKVDKKPATLSADGTSNVVDTKVKSSVLKGSETKGPKKKVSPESSPPAVCTAIAPPRNQKVITPKIVFIDPEKESQRPENTSSAKLDSGSATPSKLEGGIKISPTAKLVPVCSLQNLGAMSPGAKGAFTISSASLLSLASQGTQFLVSSNPDGTFTTSAINVANSSSVPEGPGQIKIDLVELAKTVSALTPQPTTSLPACETPAQTSSSCSPLYKKSPKLFLPGTKQEPISEGKIKKRKRSKIPDWEVPSAVYQTQFDAPQAQFVRDDSPIHYPEEKGMEKKDYFGIMGIVNKADVKKTDGKEHRNHRLAGGKLRRVCKPKISPEMVYRRFSLARGCIMHDVLVDSDEEHDGNSPRVGDKTAVIKTEQSKKGSLSPKIHDTYRQHCNKIPVISIEKVNKSGPSSEGQSSPQAAGKSGNFLKENEPPLGKGRGEGSTGGTPKSKKNKDKSGQCTKNTKTSKPAVKSKHSESKTTVGKGLTKSKSFEVPKKSTGKATLTKTKSMPSTSHHKKIQPGPSKVQAGPSKVQPAIKEEEEDDGTKRRSARFKGSKRKQWWHLLRANPDEFEEDKEWNKEVALQEAKKQARIERQHQRDESDEDDEEEEEEGAVEETALPQKKSPKKPKKKGKVEKGDEDIKEEPNEEQAEEPPPKPKPKKKKKPSKESTHMKKGTEEDQADGSKVDLTQEKPTKKEGLKRKASESGLMEPPVKKIKEEPLSDQGSDNEADEKRIFKPKKKKSAVEKEEEPEEKKKITKDVVILGEDGEPLDIKYHTAVYDQVHAMLEVKDPEELASTGIMELSVPPYSPQSFIEILARQQQIRRPHSPLGMLPVIRSDIVYKTKESECLAPHICSVCWINDHMYCRNMKRIARDLPLSGRCIHYVPCEHFRQKDSPSMVGRRRMSRKLHKAACASNKTTDSQSTTDHVFSPPGVARRINFSAGDAEKSARVSPSLNTKDELLCEEILTESDSEPHSPEAGPPPGTELLKYELRARAGQIKRSLGFRRLPLTISPMKRKLQGWEILEEPEDVEGDSTEVDIEEYAAMEEVGEGMFPQQMFIPLSGDYIVKESSMKREAWRDDASVFMPNTEEDALEKDQEELGHLKQEPVYKDYEESLYGENSQDSTETSLSQNSTRDDYESDDSGQDATEQSDREKKRKKKRRKVDSSTFGPIRVDSTCDVSTEGLKNKWQQSDDGTQVLTFTTKEIREKKPELLQYVKRAGLVGVITEKLQSERKSIQKLVKESDQSLRQSQDKLEQHRCLMAAVLTEIVSVKEQLRDLQTALVDEEAMCLKLRKEDRSARNQVIISEKKTKTLTRILTKAKEILPSIKTGQGDEGTAGPDNKQPVIVDTPSAAGDGPANVNASITEMSDDMKEEVVDSSSVIPIHSGVTTTSEVEIHMETSETNESIPLVLENDRFVLTEADATSGSSGAGLEASRDKAMLGQDLPLSDVPSEVELPGQVAAPSGVAVTNTEITMLEEEGGEEITSVAASTASVSNLDSQVLNVQIEGGQSDGRMVMLELPLDNATNIPTTQPNDILSGSQGYPNVVIDKPMGTENLLVERPAVSVGQTVPQIVSERPLPQAAPNLGESAKPLQSLLQVHGGSTGDSGDLKQMPILPSIFGDNINIQDVHLVSHNFQGQDLPSANLATQPQVTTAVTLPQGSNFENIILQSDELNTVLQSSNLGELPVQQADISNLIGHQGDLSKANASIAGLMVQQQSSTKQSDIGSTSVQPGDLKRTVLSGLVMPQSTIPTLSMDSVNVGNILTDQQHLDNVLIQGNIGESVILPQNSHDKGLVQSADSGGILMHPTTASSIVLPQANTSGIFVQPGQNIIQHQQPLPAPLPQNLSNILLPPNMSTATVVTQGNNVTAPANVTQQQAGAPLPSSPATNLVIDPEVLLQNINLMPSQLGQVQTIMINGQPFEVILQPADNV